MDFLSFFPLCFGICSFFTGILVWLKRADPIGKLFLLYSFAISIWGIGFAFHINNNSSEHIALIAIRVAHFGATWLATIWYHFTIILTSHESSTKVNLTLPYSLSTALSLIIPFDIFINGQQPIWNFTHYLTPGPAYVLFTLMFFALIPLGFHKLLAKIQETSGSQKKQLIGYSIVSAFGFLGGSLTFLPVYGIPFPQYGLYLLPLYPFGLAYVMMRQGLFNIEDIADAAHRDKLAAIGIISASINHEIKNPINIIHTLAQSYRKKIHNGLELSPERLDDAFHKVEEQTKRVNAIVSRFSGFAKKGVEQKAHLEALNLVAVFQNVLPLISHQLFYHKVALQQHFPNNLPLISGDALYLEQILFNLIINSAQALKGNENATIEVKATHKGNIVQLDISDNGPGIAESEQQHIFKPFYTSKKEGTGLGLYITKQLVEKNKGTITMRSEKGIGTTFTLKLKLASS